MTAYISPVPMPAPDAEAPEIYREIYGMPMFVTIPSADMSASVDFWTRGLGFIDLFTVPGQLTHLRRWAFQDVLLVPGQPATKAPAISMSFACVLLELDQIAERCRNLAASSIEGPTEQPWNSIELTVTTPENARVVMTAAKPLNQNSRTAQAMRNSGFDIPHD